MTALAVAMGRWLQPQRAQPRAEPPRLAVQLAQGPGRRARPGQTHKPCLHTLMGPAKQLSLFAIARAAGITHVVEEGREGGVSNIRGGEVRAGGVVSRPK